jgi:hypothetical protein
MVSKQTQSGPPSPLFLKSVRRHVRNAAVLKFQREVKCLAPACRQDLQHIKLHMSKLNDWYTKANMQTKNLEKWRDETIVGLKRARKIPRQGRTQVWDMCQKVLQMRTALDLLQYEHLFSDSDVE